MGNIQTVGPNEALIVSGGCFRPSRKEIIVGGWCWNTWMLTNIQRISLQIMTLNPKCEHVQSAQGVPVTMSGVVHCKITSTREFLVLAAEQFLCKSIDHIKSVILHTVEGHMRAVIGSQPIEEIVKDRKNLASMIRDAASGDLSRMGIDVLSLTIKEIKDDVEYLSSSGKKETATVKSQASISAARADKDASKREAELNKIRKELEIAAEKDLAQMKHNLEQAKLRSSQTANQSNAEASKAYDLMLACEQKAIRSIEMDIKSLELDNLVKVQQQENQRRKIELDIDVKLPCLAKTYKINKEAETSEMKCMIMTEAEEYSLRIKGQAQAEATKLEGLAEANGMKSLAEAKKEFNEAAILFEKLKVLPDVAAEIANPFQRFDEIVLVSDGNHESTKRKGSEKGNILRTTTSGLAAEAAKLSSSVPTIVKAVGGNNRMSSNIMNSILQIQKAAI